MSLLNLDSYTTNKEIADAIVERVVEYGYSELKEAMAKKFVFQDKAIDALYSGLRHMKNVYLSGAGGFGKSELVKAVLDFYELPHHTVTGYKDMPIDALLGTTNIKKLIEESEYELAFDKSVFRRRGILKGEEFGDILPSTAAGLKDVLTEKRFRNKGKPIESYVPMMIITSNKSPNEIADDESKRAFYISRFPLKVDVTWESYTARDYYKLLKLKYVDEELNNKLFFISQLFADNYSKYSNLISPRTALEITEVFLESGIKFIESFDINLDDIADIQRRADIAYNKKSMGAAIKSLSKLVDQERIKNSRESMTTLAYIYCKLDECVVSPDVVGNFMDLKNSVGLAIKGKPHTLRYLVDKELNILNYDV
ncbi:MAG: AAA family ATPase [Chlamydiia bacterium]|nr:AAA family ATPase [Chlamydiia bacterium]